MAVLFVSLIIIFLISFYGYFLRKIRYWKNKKVPHVKPTPVLGNFGDYIFLKKYIGHVTQDICRSFPGEPYVGAFYGSEPALIVKDPELIKLVMTKDFYYFSSREISKYTHNEVITQNLFFTYGDRWKVIRQNMTPIFSSAKMKNMFHLIRKCCYGFEELLDHETSISNEIEMRHIMARYTMDCIGNCVFGMDTQTMAKGSDNNPFFVIGQKILETSTPLALRWILRSMWPAIFYGLKLKTFSPEGDEFFKNLLTTVFNERVSKPSTRHDFIDFMVGFKKNKYLVGDSVSNSKSGDDKKVKLVVDDDLLVAQCLAMFLAGYETSSITLAFTLFELAKDKAAQNRVQEEIDDYLNRHGDTIEYDVVTSLTYAEACVDEALRLYPVLPVLTRELVEDYTFPSGLTLEKNMRVHIPVYYLHHNPSYFPEPESFKPERFLAEEKQNIKPYTYMPFGEGPRLCIGKRFAKMQVLPGLVTILKKFTVELGDGMPTVLDFDPRAIVTQAAIGVRLKLTPRPASQQRTFAKTQST